MLTDTSLKNCCQLLQVVQDLHSCQQTYGEYIKSKLTKKIQSGNSNEEKENWSKYISIYLVFWFVFFTYKASMKIRTIVFSNDLYSLNFELLTGASPPPHSHRSLTPPKHVGGGRQRTTI